MNKNQFLLALSFVLLIASGLLWGLMWWQNQNPTPGQIQIVAVQPDLQLLAVAPIPILNSDFNSSSSASVALPLLSATGVIALDVDSGALLLEKNSHQSLPPASSIKMMTALVAREIYPLEQILTISPQDLTQSNAIGLVAGEELTVADLIQAMLVNSSNESAQALANHSSLGATAFMERMNEKARELHLTETEFISPEGFDFPAQKTSARDLSLLAMELLKDPYLAEIVALPRTTILAATGQIHELDNTNQFLASPPTLYLKDGRRLPTSFSGIKTGTTPAAGEVLVTLATVDGRRLLLVVLGSKNRYTDSTQILTWIFNNYTWQDY